MRILIGNHIDPAIRDRRDLRAWTQRVLWFARDGDVVILCCSPDERFLSYVTSLTEVTPDELTILVAPPGEFGHRLLDPNSLEDPDFVRLVRAALGGHPQNRVTEVFALWPSAHVARFAVALGIDDRFGGARFFAQSGGEMVNSKATFRMLAAAAGVPIPDGAVCRTVREAVTASARLLDNGPAFVVKQAHNGAGVGNQLVVAGPALPADHVGARHLHQLGTDEAALSSYWTERWSWASAHGRFPVVVEQFVDHRRSVYSEHHATDEGTLPTECGELHYVGRRLSHQTVPLRDATETTRVQLLDGGTRLARAYRGIGYRGHLSADAVVTTTEDVLFTEVNAQVSGSLHIYQEIAHGIVGVSATPRRTVVEYHVPPHWAVPDFATFVDALDEIGCAWDPATRRGVIVSMPADLVDPGRAQFVFCLAYSDAADHDALWRRLDTRFVGAPAGPHRPLAPAAAVVPPAPIDHGGHP